MKKKPQWIIWRALSFDIIRGRRDASSDCQVNIFFIIYTNICAHNMRLLRSREKGSLYQIAVKNLQCNAAKLIWMRDASRRVMFNVQYISNMHRPAHQCSYTSIYSYICTRARYTKLFSERVRVCVCVGCKAQTPTWKIERTWRQQTYKAYIKWRRSGAAAAAATERTILRVAQ